MSNNKQSEPEVTLEVYAKHETDEVFIKIVKGQGEILVTLTTAVALQLAEQIKQLKDERKNTTES